MKDETREKLYNFLDKNTIFIIIIVAILAFFLTLNYEQDVNTSYKAKVKRLPSSFGERTALGLLESLQAGATIYVNQQRTQPKQFSDFVVSSGYATGAKTITFENVRSQIISIGKLSATSFTLSFKPSGKGKATYYMKGTNITATYNGFSGF